MEQGTGQVHVLEGLAGVASGRRIPLPPTGLTVGKRPDNALCLQDDFVSRAHAEFLFRGGELWLVDLGSTNGTFVNDVQVQRRRLHGGDRIQIGSSVLEYRDRPIGVLDEDAVAGGGPQPTTIRRVQPPAPASPAVPSSEDARALAALADLARARAGALPADEALGRILGLLFDVVPVERSCVVLQQPDGTLTTEVVRYRDPGAARADMPLSRTLLGRAIESRSALLIADALADEALAQAASVLAHRLRCVAYIPLLFGDEVVGALCMDTSVPGALRDEHLDRLVAFANQAAMVAYQARLHETIRREVRRRERLQRFLPQAVADQYAREGTEPALGGEEREVTVLFADLRGYTSMAEKMPPREAVALLNTIFERLAAPVLAHGGTLDKYIGDCVMALFGAPLGDDEHCLRAVRTGLEMQTEMAALASELAERYASLGIGVAINSGRAVVGNIGSEAKMDYTAIGDVVNVAARVEDLAGPGQILVTEAVAERAGERLRLEPYQTLALRGREQPTQVYRVAAINE